MQYVIDNNLIVEYDTLEMKERIIGRTQEAKKFLVNEVEKYGLYTISFGVSFTAADKIIGHAENIDALKHGFLVATGAFGLLVALDGILKPALKRATREIKNRRSDRKLK